MGNVQRALAVAVTGCILSLTACGGSSSDGSSDKYKQTWPKNYSATTCAEFKTKMTEHQRWVTAADMLSAARSKDDASADMPADSLVDTFESGLNNACVIDSENMAEMGATLYLTERSTFRP